MNERIFCAALVMPYSRLHARIQGNHNFCPPVWGIFDSDPAFGTTELRFGDGTGIDIRPHELADLHLLPSIDDATLSTMFD